MSIIVSMTHEFSSEKNNSTNEEQEIDQSVVKINVLCNENRWQCVC